MAKKKPVGSPPSEVPGDTNPQPGVEAAQRGLSPHCQRCAAMLTEIYDPEVVEKSAEANKLIQAKKELDIMLGRAPFGAEPYGGSNIVGTQIHQKQTNGVTTGEFCITVYVKQKAPEGDPVFGMIPKTIKIGNDEVPTDIIVVGTAKPHAHPGGSIGGTPGSSGRSMRGTIAAFVKCNVKGDFTFILSNQHVLNPSGFANAGQIVTEGNQQIGKLATWTRVDHPTVDAALAVVTDDNAVNLNNGFFPLNPQWMTTQDIKSLLDASGGAILVKKVGSQTGLTFGVLNRDRTSVDSTGEESVPPRTYQDQWMITSSTNQSFSSGGDSGSLVVHHPSNRPIALLWGGPEGSNVSYANQIEFVQSTFGITQFL